MHAPRHVLPGNECFLVGMAAPVNVLQLGSDERTIESMAAITAVEAALGTY